jgi:hypothetical protein
VNAREGGGSKQGDKHPYGKSLSVHHIRIQSYTFFGKLPSIFRGKHLWSILRRITNLRGRRLLILEAEDY